MAVIFIYLILASQFGSFLQPLAIMASLPFTLIGVFIALLVTGSTLNMFSVIGIIMLMGLVTKNAILLVDFTNHGIREGMSRHDAILAAGQVRLRPILMTTAAMIFGMLPMAIGGIDGGESERAHGPRGDRRHHHLDAAHPGRGARALHVSGHVGPQDLGASEAEGRDQVRRRQHRPGRRRSRERLGRYFCSRKLVQ